METTNSQYTKVRKLCRDIFEKKTKDYGTSWRILRPSSLTDQIFIKAQRIRTIQETGKAKIDEPFEDAFMAIVNYFVMAIYQVRVKPENENLNVEKCLIEYDKIFEEAYELMHRKNHDYGEAWREMRVTSITDMILTKILRIKQIEDNDGNTLASEGVEGNYFDMLNYAVFSLIHLSEK